MSEVSASAVPEQQQMEGGANTEYEISLIQPCDWEHTSVMLADAFSDKHGRCCCAYICSRSAAIKQHLDAFKKTQEQNPGKLNHIAVVRGSEGSILGYCALQFQGDVGNLAMPSGMRHKLHPGEVYLEQIGVSDHARGKGIGKKLMAWAHDQARASGATFISLEVMAANRAVGLYKREGYVVTPNPEGEDFCSLCVTACMIWSCMGCRCRAYYMVKQL